MPQPPKARLLVVDDEPRQLDAVSEMLKDEAYEVCIATSAAEALPLVESRFFDLLILDEQMTGSTGSELLEKSRDHHPDIGAIFLTGHADVDTAVKALRLGALDFLRKGHKPDDLLSAVRRALTLTRAAREKRLYWYKVEKATRFTRIIGRSTALKNALDLAKRVAPTSASVLLQGESGTGKELFAKAVHDWSHRKQGPFVAFNCAAVSPGLVDSTLFGYKKGAFTGAEETSPGYFEAAHGGTIFLDEIGEMPLDVQPKLLRALEVKKVIRLGDTSEIPTDVRVIAATNRDLRTECDAGRFRKDLFYRISKATVMIPPLRARGDDIGLLAEHLLRRNCRDIGRSVHLSPEAIARLKGYSWPGNLRELDHVIYNAIMTSLGDVIAAEALPLPNRGPATRLMAEKPARIFEEAEIEFEREYFRDRLDLAKGNKTLAAKLAGMDRGRLYEHLYKVGLAKKRKGRETHPLA